MDLGIKGKKAIVCAASKGLGKGCAESLAREGVDVTICARTPETLEATAEEIRALGGGAVTAVACDITTPEGQSAVLEACPACHKWAILEREPLARWSDGRVVLLGDACHPMTPYMAQGAATSIEDAAILARCLAEVDKTGIEGAFQRYEAHRKPRTSRIQAISSANTWLQTAEPDTDWLYGYDAWNADLDAAAAS